MLAAVIHGIGATPELEDLPSPEPARGTQVVDVVAAGLNPVDLAVAAGSFSGGTPMFPYVAGREGVGRRSDGRLFYFDSPRPPHGALAERTLAEPEACVPLPPGLDPALAIACGISGRAAWLSLSWRARLAAGESVLVLGASGTVGRLAVQAARLLEAGRVVAVTRDASAYDALLAVGAHQVVVWDSTRDDEAALHEAAGPAVDVIVDPVWGAVAEAAIGCLAPGGRLVQVGESAGRQARFHGALLRGRGLTVMGYSNLQVPRDVKRAAYVRLSDLAAAGCLSIPLERVPLLDVATAWTRQREVRGRKIVVEVGS